MVVTTGTFLRGVLHVGGKRIPAGRMPTTITEKPDATAARGAHALADRLYGLGFQVGLFLFAVYFYLHMGNSTDGVFCVRVQMGRLKTGTPPRIDGASIDYSGLEEQPGDQPPRPFGFLNAYKGWVPPVKQVSCWATRTTSETERVMKEAKGFLNFEGEFILFLLVRAICMTSCFIQRR